MTEVQFQHATTLISLLHPKPTADALVEITALAPRARPMKRYFTDATLAAQVGLEWNDQGYSVFVNVNGRREFAGFESSVSAVTTLVMDLQTTRTSISDVYRRLEQVGIPPSITAVSGNGQHAYLLLDQPYELHTAKIQAERLCKVTGSDPVFNGNRIFRLTGTVNYKTPPTLCYLTGMNPERKYTLARVEHALDLLGAPPPRGPAGGAPAAPADPPADWFVLRNRLSEGVRDIIESGEKNAYSEKQVTRSEADWVVVCALVKADATDEMITWVFTHTNARLVKVYDAGLHYLNQTIRAARRALAERPHHSGRRASDSHISSNGGAAAEARAARRNNR